MIRLFLLPIFTVLVFAETEIKSIKFNNLSRISLDVAYENANINKGEPIDEEKLNNALKSFYNFGYFDDISIQNNDGNILFNFVEKPSITKIEIKGYKNREEDLEELYEAIKIKKGNMFTQTKVDNAKKILLDMLKIEGHYNSVIEIEIKKINDTALELVFEVNKGDSIIINDIYYHGAKQFEEDDFNDVVANKEKESFSWFIGRNDGKMNLEQLEFEHLRIRELYLEYGYLETKVSKAFSKINFNINKSSINFFITEGPQYKIGDVSIILDENIIESSELMKENLLIKNDIFNIKNLRLSSEKIRTKIANMGYAFTRVDYDIKQDKENHIADIVFHVNSGDKVSINNVLITGNYRTLDRVIRRNIYLAPGDTFSLDDLRDSKNALGRTGYFDNVEIENKRVTSDKLDLLVSIEEARTGNLIIGGGYGDLDGWSISGSINDKNIFGSGLNLGLAIEHSKNNDDSKLSLSNPAINDSKYSGSLNTYITKTLTRDYNSTVGDKTDNTLGFSLGIGRGFGRHTRAGFHLASEETNVEYELNKDNYIYKTNSITPYFSFNNTDDYYIPRNGVIFSTSLKKTGLGGDANYLLSSSTFKYFYSLLNLIDYDLIIKNKTRFKLLRDTGEIPVGTTFTLGGPTSLRGYRSRSIRPSKFEEYSIFQKYLTSTIELDMPLIRAAKMRWSLFYDYGSIGEEDISSIQRSSYGLSLNWFSPVGPMQFIFSTPIDNLPTDGISKFQFNLGSTF